MTEPRGFNREAVLRWPRYPSYRTSGVEWLREIPGHWEVVRVKHVLTRNDGGVWGSEGGIEGTIVLRSTEQRVDGVWDISDPAVRELTPQEYAAARLVQGDLVVTKSSGSARHIGKTSLVTAEVEALDCCHSNFMQRLRVRRTRVVPRYLWYVLNGDLGRRQFDYQSETTTGLANLSGKTIGMVRIATPSVSEQSSISGFLDRETAKVDALVAKQQELIRLLQEKRSALISQAVTMGLDPDVAMKDSGVEWLGKIPAHWGVVQLRRVAFDRCDGPFGSGLKSTHYAEEGVRVVRLQNIGYGEFEDADAAFIPQEHCSELGDHSVIPGDLLIAGLGDTNHPPGRACVAPEDIGSAMVKADCFRFRIDQSRATPQFLAYQLSATASVASGLMSTGATRQRTNLTSTAARAIAIPDPEEQSRIAGYITRKTVSLDHAQHAVQRAIALLNDYRTALISAAVTGKIDVRHALEPTTTLNPTTHHPTP